jgi:uncharacterized protein YaaW (UPF0174 family)
MAHTGASDKTFNLVSVLYHVLQGGETYAQYITDAQEAGDQELAEFFRDLQQQHRQVADRAKSLLSGRLS